MSHLPGGRRTHVYNPQEWAAIDPFKAGYLSTMSAAARKTITQNHIFLALWNYWASSQHQYTQLVRTLPDGREEYFGWNDRGGKE